MVPTNYPTIQEAIQASMNGDTVLVEPGTYFENLNFRGKNIVLTSMYYLSKDSTFICSTIINGSQPLSPDTASCIILNSGEDSTAIVQGFTITGGTGTIWDDIHGAGTYREGGGIITESSSPIIRWNHIVNNFVTNTTGVVTTGGGGIRSGDGHPHIYNNIISNNEGRYGCGIVMNYCNNAEIKNNLIVYNKGGQSFGGGGIWATGNSSTVLFVYNNTIANNHVSGSGTYGGKGGGIFVFSILIHTKCNIIWGNTQTTGNSIVAFLGGGLSGNYSDIDFFYSGTGNIDTDPLFTDSINFFLSPHTPCIDAGDTSAFYNDLSSVPGSALLPSQGTERNDMGVYGGLLSKYFPSCSLDPTKIEEVNESESFFVSPNPSNGHLFLHSIINQTLDVAVFSALGKCVFNQKIESNKVFQLIHLRDGIYYLKITTSKQKLSIKKIIINN